MSLVKLARGREKRVHAGHPWVYSNELATEPALKDITPGSLVTVADAAGHPLGIATFNRHSLIALRILSRDPRAVVDTAFLADRLRTALALRETLFDRPFYRLIHSEADGLPGLILDRYGDVASLQANSAGMEALLPQIGEAVKQVLAPRALVLRNDSAVRALEGLENYTRLAWGSLDQPVAVEENGVTYYADLTEGQKTGWFFDQRDNRAFIARLSGGRSVLDLYSYTGSFALQAARGGARQVLAVDRSESALALAERAARHNGFGEICRFRRGEVFAEVERMTETFGLVIADPPAFVKSKKDLAAGARGYRKLARLAAGRVEKGGFLLIASCSHHVDAALFAEEVRGGLAAAGREGRILRAAGAGPDHPVHPALPESAYLKALVLQLD